MFRRSEPRSSRSPSALVRVGDDEHECTIVDLSERGARLSTAAESLPDTFELSLDGRALTRSAQVRWRNGGEIGIQFLPRKRGDVVPEIHLGAIEGPHRTVDLRPLVANGRSVLVGVVGAFAPERLHLHLTEVQNRAPDLHRLGFARIICVAPNDPWTVRAWASTIDPEHRLHFLSDGNLDLARWLGVSFFTSRRRHLGPRSRSYLALLRAGVIERLTLDDVSGLSFDERAEARPAAASVAA